MADPIKIHALLQTNIQQVTEKYLESGDLNVWKQDMQEAIVKGHTAAFITGIAERSFGGKVRQFLSKFIGEYALSKSDRTQLRELISNQLKFFNGFIDDVLQNKLSPAQIAARANMYAGATRATYYHSQLGDWILPFYPGDGATQCKGSCRCSARVEDNVDGSGDYIYVLGGENHCPDCPKRAAGSPYKVYRR